MSPDPLDAIWLSALLEGEGCFDLSKGRPRVRVKMTDLDIIQRAATIMGAPTPIKDNSYLKFPGHKPQFVATVHGPKALAVMYAIYHLMGQRRRAKIEDIINLHPLPIGASA